VLLFVWGRQQKAPLQWGFFVIMPSQKGGSVMKITITIGIFKINFTVDSKIILALVRFLF
jgi:hypothetical protein